MNEILTLFSETLASNLGFQLAVAVMLVTLSLIAGGCFMFRWQQCEIHELHVRHSELKRSLRRAEKRVSEFKREKQELQDEHEKEKHILGNRLMQTQKYECLSDVTTGLTHEMSNAIAPIRLASEFLSVARDELTSKQKRMVDMIHTSAKRADQHVKHLAMFARTTHFNPVVLEIPDFLEQMQQILIKNFNENVVLSIEASDRLHSIEADASQLYQCLTSICMNARDAMPQGGSLLIRAKNFEIFEGEVALTPIDLPSGEFVCIEIIDTGVGMDVTALSHALEPFFSTKDRSQSSGLGLSTARAIIERHCGFLHIESKPDVGTKVTVWFPAAKAAANEVDVEVDSPASITHISEGVA